MLMSGHRAKDGLQRDRETSEMMHVRQQDRSVTQVTQKRSDRGRQGDEFTALSEVRIRQSHLCSVDASAGSIKTSPPTDTGDSGGAKN